jgi:hypothetical protein
MHLGCLAPMRLIPLPTFLLKVLIECCLRRSYGFLVDPKLEASSGISKQMNKVFRQVSWMSKVHWGGEHTYPAKEGPVQSS